MALRKRPLAAGIAAFLFSSWVSAIGLGDITLNSALNEPLDAEIKLLNIGDASEAEMLAGLGSAEDFALAGVDKEFVLSRLKFDLDLAGPKGPVIRVTSQDPIREPYLDFLVELEWPSGRLLREYTLLLDLPVFSGDVAKKPVPPVTRAPAQRQSEVSAGAVEQSGGYSPGMTGGETYVVQSGDTLWSIASRLSGDESTYKKMAAIEQLNPSAFIAGDINRIKRGHVLRVPTNTQIADTDRTSLTQRLQQSASQDVEEKPVWNATPEENTASDSEALDDSKARLSLSTSPSSMGLASGAGENDSGVNSSVTREDLENITEELDKTNRENAELKERLANLEEQLATMEKMLTLQDSDLAAVQQGIGQLDEENVLEAADASAGEEPVAATDEKAPDGNEITENQTDKTDDQNVVAESAVSKATFQKEKGWLEKFSDYMAYGLALLVILIGAVITLVLRKRRENDELPIPVSSGTRSGRNEPTFNDVEDQAEEEIDDVTDTDFHVGSIDEIELREEDDLFAEDVSTEDVFIPVTEEDVREENDDLTEDEFELPDGESVSLEETPESDTDSLETDAQLEDNENLEIDLSELDLDEPAQSSDSTDEAKTLEQALNLDEFDFLGGADAADTQLELAQAYIDMGDIAGAKEILEEVLDSGNDEQKSRATELMTQLTSD